MTEPNEIIHQSHRLKIMAALDGEPDPIDFARLKLISGATDGNLGAHLSTLGKAGYISIEKEPVGRRTRTLVTITVNGAAAFRRHLDYLRSVIESVGR